MYGTRTFHRTYLDSCNDLNLIIALHFYFTSHNVSPFSCVRKLNTKFKFTINIITNLFLNLLFSYLTLVLHYVQLMIPKFWT
jgi:hypothetical protein